MPAPAASVPLVAVDSPAGVAGLHAVATALRLAAAGSQSSLLIPQYAPEPVRAQLHHLLAERTWLGAGGPAVCVPTSGSTGAVKAVVQPWQTLSAAAASRDEVLGGPAAWFVAVPPATAGGVIALTRALRAQSPVAGWSGAGGAGRFTAESFAAESADLLARAHAAGLPARVSLVATQLARLVEAAEGAAALRRFDTVLVGGGPLSSRVRQAATAVDLRVVHTYGMTETCGGFVYDGVPTPGTRIAVTQDAQILAGGDCLAACYLDSPLPIEDGWLRTGDRGRWDGTRLSVLGRGDDIVTVRGANVDLTAVWEALDSCAGVAQCGVAAVPDPHGGHRLRAFVVGEVDPGVLQATVRNKLGAAAVPEISVVAQLPSNLGGKVDVQQLQEDSAWRR